MTGEIPAGSVIVTPEDMWKTVGDIRDTAIRTERAVSELQLTVNPALNDLRADIETNARIEREHHEKQEAKLQALDDKWAARIRPIEEASWASRWVPAIVMSLLVSTIGGVLLYVVINTLN